LYCFQLYSCNTAKAIDQTIGKSYHSINCAANLKACHSIPLVSGTSKLNHQVKGKVKMRFNNTKIIYSLLYLVSMLLSACSGGGGGGVSGGSSGGSTSTLSGVVAVGTPVASSNVSVVCATGSKLTALSGSDGSWSVTISGQTLPCAAEAAGGTINNVANTTAYHSIATAAGTMNITPLTELLVANLTGSSPGTWFVGLSTSTTPLTVVTSTTVSTALSSLSTSFNGLTKLATTNPITTTFTPTSGNASDDMLTALATAITNSGVTYATLVSNTATGTAIPSSVNTQLPIAYAGTTSGSGSTYLLGGAVQGKALSLAGTVSSFTGTANTAMSTGSTNGAAASATFNFPLGVTTDGTNLYVADQNNNKIRQIVIATGVITTLAGSGVQGAADGTGTAATFNGPQGITTDGINLYVADIGNRKIRKIAIATGVVTSVTGAANTAMSTGAADGVAVSATFGMNFSGITTDGANLYIADDDNKKIRKITIATGVVSSFTGTANTAMSSGAADGSAASATFYSPTGITTDGTNLFVLDSGNLGVNNGGNNKIRKIVIATGVVSSFTGATNTALNAGATDGAADSAAFSTPIGITTDGTNLFVSDTYNNKIRKVVIATGAVSSLTGTVNTAMSAGATDGAAASATFKLPMGITTDGTHLFIVDMWNNKIREIQ
jgi:sugar lactone lactonase YvrE